MLINSKIAVQNEGSVCSDRKGSVCAEYPAIPLYKEEIEFKIKHGTTSLMQRFEEYKIDEIVDVNRPNVCGQ